MPRHARPFRPLSLPHHPPVSPVPVGQAATLDHALVRTLLAHHPARRFLEVVVRGSLEEDTLLRLPWTRQEESLAAAAALDGRLRPGRHRSHTGREPATATVVRPARHITIDRTIGGLDG